MITDTRKSKYAKVKALPSEAIEWTNGLWADTMEVCRESMVPQLKRMFDAKEISHVVENFRICAGEAQGEHDGTVFGDGDFYKWLEAYLYVSIEKYGKLPKEFDEYIDLVSRAQQPDGYLSTKQIIGEMNANGIQRMGDVNDFEVYNFGHLFTCASLHYRMTGNDSLLKVAKKAADYLNNLYEEAVKSGEVQTAVCPSHYMGLIELYRTTGEEKYLDLAKLSIALRDSVKNGTDDNQDRIKLKQHDKIIGHAVRANYLYSGVADLCAEIEDEEYVKMLHLVWDSLMNHKIYLTGGCGALYNGVSPYGNFFIDQKTHQAYGYEYQLPNITAYNETCANIGLVMWAYRMFTIEPKAKYFDVIERTMLNVNLAAVSLDGKRYFYENMLRRTKKLEYEMVWSLERTEYITSYCCPPNLARILAQSKEYAYTISKDCIYMGMYGANKANIQLENGADFVLIQETDYPYDGHIHLRMEQVKQDARTTFKIRVPSWVEEGFITVGTSDQKKVTSKDANHYISITLDTLKEGTIDIYFEMPVRFTISHPMVEENTNQVAIEKGPLVYCIESMDTQLDTLDDLIIQPGADFKQVPLAIDNRVTIALETQMYQLNRKGYDRNQLYQTLKETTVKKVDVRLIPYFAWDNRGFGEMKIWIPLAYKIEG
ncbi:MAG: glycoside hydrolase family 127 protein [Candidatus Galacturonibacter soehngenii]|nr:glycoside hydrolase family 127 protein [Candidatus Galacturonibacter soehngenii]